MLKRFLEQNFMDLPLPFPSSPISERNLVQSPRRPAFRNDINGLRAWAVLAVMLYHFSIPGVSGGFIGVDVFFVISGYLMTSIVLTGLAAKKFSLFEFYLARVKRIVPALLTLCALLMIIAWFLPLTGVEYQALAKHVRDSVLFFSNHTYAREAGYFDVAAHEKWLLHTWSLSVEWQFYLILPLILLAAQRWLKQPQRQGALLAGLCLLSLGLCLNKTTFNPTEAFYSLPFRSWEMLAGGLVYIYAPRLNDLLQQRGAALSMVGMAVLLGGFALLDPSDAWPGWYTIVPVLATMLILACRHDKGWLVANPVTQWLGTRSYSVYLWHWPLVVGSGLYGWQENLLARMTAILAAVGLGALSYRWVEIMVRRRTADASPRTLWLVSAVAVLVVAGPANWIAKHDEQTWRTRPDSVLQIEREAQKSVPWRAECWDGASPAGCVYGKEPVGAMLIGDSHAGVTINAASQAASETDSGVRFWAKGACMTVFDTLNDENSGGQKCVEFNNLLQREVTKVDAAVPLIIVNRASLYPNGALQGESHRWGVPQARLTSAESVERPEFLAEYRRRLINTACYYARQRPVYYVKPIPEFGSSVPNAMARRVMREGAGASDVTLPLAEYYKRHAFILDALEEAHQRCGVHLLDPVPYLCQKERCMGSFHGKPLYSDGNHLSEYGSRFLVPMFREVFVR